MSVRNFTAVQQALEADARPSRKAVLGTILGLIEKNNFAALESHFTEATELHISGFPSIDGSWKGRQEVVEAIARNFGKIAEQHSRVEAMIEQGDSIALLMSEHGVLNGEPYRVRGVLWWTFEGDQVARTEEFVTRVA
jgi:ketosteroid isomerase-like protein